MPPQPIAVGVLVATQPDPAPERTPSQFALLRQRRYAPFFWTQFLGAANDNIFKVAFTGLVKSAKS